MNNAKRRVLLRSILERGCVGVRHKAPSRRLNRYVMECQGRHNGRESGTIDRMGGIVEGMGGTRLRYRALVKPDDLPSCAPG